MKPVDGRVVCVRESEISAEDSRWMWARFHRRRDGKMGVPYLSQHKSFLTTLIEFVPIGFVCISQVRYYPRCTRRDKFLLSEFQCKIQTLKNTSLPLFPSYLLWNKNTHRPAKSGQFDWDYIYCTFTSFSYSCSKSLLLFSVNHLRSNVPRQTHRTLLTKANCLFQTD